MGRTMLMALTALIFFGTASAFAENDRNNEPACQELGTVDPRCF